MQVKKLWESNVKIPKVKICGKKNYNLSIKLNK